MLPEARALLLCSLPSSAPAVAASTQRGLGELASRCLWESASWPGLESWGESKAASACLLGPQATANLSGALEGVEVL